MSIVVQDRLETIDEFIGRIGIVEEVPIDALDFPDTRTDHRFALGEIFEQLQRYGRMGEWRAFERVQADVHLPKGTRNCLALGEFREVDHVFHIRSGPEIGVDAAKTFASQLAYLNLLHVALARPGTDRAVVSALPDLPAYVQSLLDDSAARAVAETYGDSNAFFFIGRGYHYPVAPEGVLKMKEITYSHAEGFAAGELKHGPLTRVTEDKPLFAVGTGDDELSRKTVWNVKEVEARNAPIVAVTDWQDDLERYADHVLEVP